MRKPSAWASASPLFIGFPEGEASSIDLTPDEFYDRLVDVSRNPHDRATFPGIFAEMFKLAAEDDEIFSVHISSGLSGTAPSRARRQRA